MYYQLSRAKLTARWIIDMPWRTFLSPEFRKKVPVGNTLIFVDTRISLKHTVGLLKEASLPKTR